MAGKSGGAWKVAYADFVTAMMAFFLVMWLCAQNQEVKRSVADYFSDPMGAIDAGSGRKPSRTGSITESINTGRVPEQDRVSLSMHGRQTYSPARGASATTKLVGDWLRYDEQATKYWQQQVLVQSEAARYADDVTKKKSSVKQAAVALLSKQLKEELLREAPSKVDGIHRTLLVDALKDVNWTELAQDLIGP